MGIRALNMAIAIRTSPKGCSHHTDRGSQYCSYDYQNILRQHGFQISMIGKGNLNVHSHIISRMQEDAAEQLDAAIRREIKPNPRTIR